MQATVVEFSKGGVIVTIDNINYLTCSLRGKVKKQGQSVLVGDRVLIDEINKSIESVLPRKNQLIRPKVANVDQVLICLSSEPPCDLLLVDKLIILANDNKITPIVCVTKLDILDKQFINEIKEQYEPLGVKVIEISATKNENINKLWQILKNKITVLAGQSGVGKSTLLNTLNKSLNIKTSDLTSKILRGKNTTTETKLYVLQNNALVLDTPGFSVLELSKITAQEFLMAYPDIYKFAKDCNYKSCNHIDKSSTECGVNRALEEGKINKARYDRFCREYLRLAGKRPIYNKTNKKGKNNV